MNDERETPEIQDAADITVGAYLQALLELKQAGRIKEKQRLWLRIHYHEKDRTITAVDLGQRTGYRDHRGVNRWYGELAGQLARKVNYQPQPSEKYTNLSTVVTFEPDKPPFPMKLRPNFVRALELLGWVQGNNNSFESAAKKTKPISDSILNDLEKFYPDIIAALPDTFDAHQFILELAHQQQRLYALARYADTDRPFQILHGILAQRLHQFAHLITKVGEQNSPDIFGQTNSASLWQKHG